MTTAVAHDHAGRELPRWGAVLAVVAHPDDESFGLGAVLAAFVDGSARVAVLCLTHGELSTVRGVEGDLYRIRSREFTAAAGELGVTSATLLHHPDGALAAECRTRLAGEIIDAARDARPDGLLVFDPSGVTGHQDHVAATSAALAAADILELPVLGWTLPAALARTLNTEHGGAFSGHRPDDIDYVITVDRSRQHAAIASHASQALPSSVLWRRLQLLGGTEHLRWLRIPTSGNNNPDSIVDQTYPPGYLER